MKFKDVIVSEQWSQKYKNSINCSHPRGFSQRAHCAGKKKHNESIEMEMTCPDCGMCQTHGNISEIKQRLDAKCWKGKHKEGTKIKGGIRVNNCVPNESVAEGKDIDARISNLKDAIRSETPRSVPGEDHREQYARHAEKIAGYKAELKKLMAQKKQGVAESSQPVDSLVTDALKLMRGPEANDAVSALKTVLGDREYNQRRGHYNFYIRQMMNMYGQQGVAEGQGDRRRFIRHNIWTAMDSDEEVLQHAVEGDPFYSAKKFMRDLDDQGYDFTHVISPEGEITYSPQHDPRHLKNFPEQGVDEADMSRRGFLKGLGAAVAGAAGLGAANAGTDDPEYNRKVQQQHQEMMEKNPRYAKEHADLNIVIVRGISGQSAENNKRWYQKTAQLLQKYGVRVNEGVAEDYDSGEYNDEAGMAQGNLHTIAMAAQGLLDTIDDKDNLPEWAQEKIAKVEGMLVTVWNYLQSQEAQGIDPEVEEMYEAMDQLAEEMAAKKGVSADLVWETFEAMDDHMLYETAAWRRKEGKSKSGGLNAKGVASYRREHPGSKLQTAVTTKPSKLKPGSKAAKRRKSFCARMSGVKGPMKKPNGKPTRKALALRKWNC